MPDVGAYSSKLRRGAAEASACEFVRERPDPCEKAERVPHVYPLRQLAVLDPVDVGQIYRRPCLTA